MKKRYLILALVLSFFIIPLSAMAQGGSRGMKPPEAIATVAVDCDAGDSITEALGTNAIDLIIEISGMCTEDVNIVRNNVTLRGTNPDFDGIIVGPSDILQVGLDLVGVNFISIEFLKFSGGFAGITINNSFGVLITDSIVEDNSVGVLAGTASGSININGTLFTNSSGGSRGLWATNGSNVTCAGCTIDNYFRGIHITQGSQVFLFGGSVTALGFNWRAVEAIGGSRFDARLGCHPFPGCTAERTSLNAADGFAIALLGTASAEIRRADLNGKIDLQQNSVTTLNGVTQINSSGPNDIRGGSNLLTQNWRGTNSLAGEYTIAEFSNLSLLGSSTIAGILTCDTGGDAYCDNSGNVTGSNCGACLNP